MSPRSTERDRQRRRREKDRNRRQRDRTRDRKRRERTAARAGGSTRWILPSILGLFAVVVALGVFVLGDRDEPVYRGPRAVTVYSIDTSGSQNLTGDDAEARDSDRRSRIDEAIADMDRQRGTVVLATFAKKGSSARTAVLDYSDRRAGCDKPDNPACTKKRDELAEDNAEELETFLAGLKPAGKTDVLAGGFRRGATLAQDQVSDANRRHLIIESDFIHTACPDSLSSDPPKWPDDPADTAEILASCPGGRAGAGLAEVADVELIGVVLTDRWDTADVQRTTAAFLAYCRKHTDCREGA